MFDPVYYVIIFHIIDETNDFNESWGTSYVKYLVDEYTEPCSEPSQTSKMERFAKIVNGF